VDAFEVYSTGAGATVLPRVVTRLSGTDPIAFLEDTTTQDLAGLKPGSSTLTCLLDDKGRVLAEMRLLFLANGSVLLDAEPAAASGIEWLARVAPLSGCEVIDETDRWTVTAVRGVRAADTLSSFGSMPPSDEVFIEMGEGFVVRVEWGPLGFDVISSSTLDVVADKVALDDFEGARISAGRPRYGVDFASTTHITETPLIDRAVSFVKGCYPGQESVARVRNLGRARKKIVVLDLDTVELPARGAAVSVDGTDVGVVTSAGIYGGEMLAMATVRTEVEGGSTVEADGVTARVRA
jgi:folate-binding protein YgfZ